MKTILAFLLAAWMVVWPCYANPLLMLAGSSPAASFTPDLVNEGAEDSGDTTPTGWTDSISSVDWGYVTSPAPLFGSESLRLGVGSINTYTSFTGKTTVECYALIHFTAIAASTTSVFGFRDSGGNALCLVQITSTGAIGVFTGGSLSTTTTNTMSTGQTYHLWMRYVSGGTCTVEFSTDGTRSGSGDGFKSKTGGTGTAARLWIGNGSCAFIADKIMVHTGTIPSNP